MSSFIFTKSKRQALLISHSTDEETGSHGGKGGTGTGTQATWLHAHASGTPPPPPGCTHPSLQPVKGGETAHTHPEHSFLKLRTPFWVKEAHLTEGRKQNSINPRAAPSSQGGFPLALPPTLGNSPASQPLPHPKSEHLVCPEAAGCHCRGSSIAHGQATERKALE